MGRCDNTHTGPYKVEKGVVTEFQFDPGIKIVFSSLGIDVSDLPTETASDVSPAVITHTDAPRGINYAVRRNLLTFIEVYPPGSFAS